MLISEIFELVSSEVFEIGLVDLPEEAVRVVLVLADRRADSRILSCNREQSDFHLAYHIQV